MDIAETKIINIAHKFIKKCQDCDLDVHIAVDIGDCISIIVCLSCGHYTWDYYTCYNKKIKILDLINSWNNKYDLQNLKFLP